MRVGVIGAGMIAAVHARSARLAGAELAAIAAGSAVSAKDAAARLGFERAYASGEELIADDSLDVVHVCTPNHLHLELATAAIAAGRNVICEKPLTTEPLAADRLAAAAAAAGVVAAVPFAYRFYPMVREARERVAAGDLGRVGLLGGCYLQDWLAAAGNSNWRVDPALGGPSRAFADIGSHWCDLVEFVTAERLAAVSAQFRTLHPQRPPAARSPRSFAAPEEDGDRSDWRAVETEDAAVVSFRTAAGTPGALLVSQVSPGAKNRLSFEVTGTEATLAFEQQAPDQLVIGELARRSTIERDPARLSPPAARYATLPAGHPQGFNDSFAAFVADVYEQIESGEPVPGLPSFADGARAVRVTDAVVRSAREEAAWVEIEADPVIVTSVDQATK